MTQAWRSAYLVVLVVGIPILVSAGRVGNDALPRHEIHVRIDPELRRLAATDHITAPSGLPADFSLARPFIVRRAAVGGAEVPAGAVGAKTWRLELGDRVATDLVVEYDGVLSGQGGRDDTGLVVGPAGTFLSGGPWYPEPGFPSVWFELTVRVPAGQVAVAPGRLVYEENSVREYTARFAAEVPANEITLLAGPYRTREKLHRGRRLRTYMDPNVADLADLYLAKTASYLDLYEGWIGKYPFTGFRVVSAPMPVGLGFAGLTYVGAQVLRLPFLPETSLGHEVLHSWWGNGVRVDAGRGNWAEGLTTFMADYGFAERKGAAAAREMRLRWLREYAELPRDRDAPLTDFRGRGHTASQVIGYHKAAMLFVMLRDELGRERFDAAIRRFWQGNRFRSVGWRELQEAFEAAARRSLAPFFSQWVERAGAPALRLRDPTARKTGRGWQVTFMLEQDLPIYRLHVPVEVVTGAGASTLVHVDLRAAAQWFTIPVVKRPRVLRVDPDFRLFRRLDPVEVPAILRSVALDGSAPVVAADEGAEALQIARALAEAFFERDAQAVSAGAPFPSGSVLVVGTDAAVASLTRRERLADPPEDVAGEGTARAWAARRGERGTVVIVSAVDLSALREITLLLPHFGADSFVVFNGRRVEKRGLLPAGRSPLSVGLAIVDGE